MNPLLLGSVFELGGKILDRLFPDPGKRAEAELELLKLTQEGDLKQIISQLEINAREAQHESIFVAGWRPFVGWVGGIGFAYASIIQYFLSWVASINSWPSPPAVDVEILLYVLGGLLGLGGLRTYEKKQKVSK